MRALVSGWTGRRVNITNLTVASEYYAKQIVKLFNETNTLSEFNRPTYFGVCLYGLTLWDKYIPEDSVMKQNAKRMVESTYKTIGSLWHPGMKSLAPS
ncbi:hypothetical protein LTR65_009880 [Meristemomyces frigidus]